jgi:hypothetical protein
LPELEDGVGKGGSSSLLFLREGGVSDIWTCCHRGCINNSTTIRNREYHIYICDRGFNISQARHVSRGWDAKVDKEPAWRIIKEILVSYSRRIAACLKITVPVLELNKELNPDGKNPRPTSDSLLLQYVPARSPRYSILLRCNLSGHYAWQ